MPYPMPQFTPVSETPAEAAEARASLDRFRTNQNRLTHEWGRLLAEHRDEWAASFGEGTVVTANSPQEIVAAIPRDELGTAVIRYIVPDDIPLAL